VRTETKDKRTREASGRKREGATSIGELQEQGKQHVEEEEEQQAKGELHVVEIDLPEGSSDRDMVESLDMPIALRKGTRAATSKQIPIYGLVHNIINYVSYEALSPSYKAFVASLQSIAIPTDWRAAKRDQKWFDAMKEELDALGKNKT
jgi:hypothetical protein